MKNNYSGKGLFCFFVALFFSSIVYAYSDAFCPPHDTEVIIDNRVTPDRLQYDYSKSVPELTEMSGKDEMGVRVRGMFTLGVKMQRKSRILHDMNGCPRIIKAYVVIDFVDSTIYVAREFLEGTDTYNYVQWHENEHARITIENNKRYLSYLEQEMRRYIGGLQIRYPDSRAEASKNNYYIAKKINDIVEREWRHLNDFIKNANEEFDFKEHQFKKQHNI